MLIAIPRLVVRRAVQEVRREVRIFLLDQISHIPVTHMTFVVTGHDDAVTGLMGVVISDVANRQPRHRGAAHAAGVTERQKWWPSYNCKNRTCVLMPTVI